MSANDGKQNIKYFEYEATQLQTMHWLQKIRMFFFVYANNTKLTVWNLFENMTLFMLFCWSSFYLLLLVDYLQVFELEINPNVHSVHSKQWFETCDVLIVYVVW